MRALVVPVAAIFLRRDVESELAELDDDEAAEILEMSEQDEAGLDQLARPAQENVRGGASHRLTMARSSGWLSPPPPDQPKRGVPSRATTAPRPRLRKRDP